LCHIVTYFLLNIEIPGNIKAIALTKPAAPANIILVIPVATSNVEKSFPCEIILTTFNKSTIPPIKHNHTPTYNPNTAPKIINIIPIMFLIVFSPLSINNYLLP